MNWDFQFGACTPSVGGTQPVFPSGTLPGGPPKTRLYPPGALNTRRGRDKHIMLRREAPDPDRVGTMVRTLTSPAARSASILTIMPGSMLVLLTISHLLVDAYVTFLSPLWPILIEKYGISLTAVGVFTSVSTLALLPVQPVTGYVVDRYGLAVILVASPIVASLSGLILLPRTFLMAALVIVLGKIGNAIFHPPAARVIAAAARGRHGLLMSIFAFGGNAGVALGPLLILGLIATMGANGGLLAVVPALIVAVLIYFSPLPGVLKKEAHVHLDEPRPSAAVLFRGPFVLLVLMMALRAGVWSALTTFVPVFLVREGASILAGGFALTIFNLSGALIGLFAGALSDRIGRRVIVVGSMVVATAALALFLMSMGILRLVWLGLVGAGLLSVTPLGVVMAQELYPQQRATVSGIMMGTTFGLGTLAIVPVVGHVGDTVNMSAGLWVLVGISLAASLLAILLPKKAVG